MKKLIISILIFALWLTLAVPTAVALKNTFAMLEGEDVTLFYGLFDSEEEPKPMTYTFGFIDDEMSQFEDRNKAHVVEYYKFDDYKKERHRVSYINRVTNQAINMLKDFEGFSNTVYECAGGKNTIGYGHTGKWSYKNAITKTKAEKLLRKEVAWTYKLIEKNVKVKLDDTQFAVLISFAYNVGQTAFRNSTLLEKLNSGDYAGVDVELKRWVYSTRHGKKKKLAGLVKRRNMEASLWNTTLINNRAA